MVIERGVVVEIDRYISIGCTAFDRHLTAEGALEDSASYPQPNNASHEHISLGPVTNTLEHIKEAYLLMTLFIQQYGLIQLHARRQTGFHQFTRIQPRRR